MPFYRFGCSFLFSIALPSFSASRWRSAYTVGALLAACGFLSAFIIHFGNRQFGAWDFGVLIDTGWRQILGQRPYTDFISPLPPAFNLGIKYAFELFGVNWNAQLYFTAIFASISFLWSYWLLSKLTGSRIASFGMALAIQCAVVLPLCFWWYNNTVSIMARFSSFLLILRESNLTRPSAAFIFPVPVDVGIYETKHRRTGGRLRDYLSDGLNRRRRRLNISYLGRCRHNPSLHAL